MTGPEHYLEAERLVAETEAAIREGAAKGAVHLDAALEVSPSALAAAQVHATLALAAATAYAAVKDYCGDESRDPREWSAVTS